MTTYIGIDNTWTKEHDSGREFVALKNWSYLPKCNIDGSVDNCYENLTITGNTAYDLSGNGFNLNLNHNSNPPTYATGESNGYGSWDYDGVNDTSSISPAISGVDNNFTHILWALPDDTIFVNSENNNSTVGTGGQRYIIGAGLVGSTPGLPTSGMGISLGTNGVQVVEHSASYMPVLTSYDNANVNGNAGRISSTKFTQIAVVTTTSGSSSGNPYHKIYINGELVRTGVESAKATVSLAGGPLVGHGSYGYFSGKIGVVKIFNYSLTDNQILREYKAYKSRYGHI